MVSAILFLLDDPAQNGPFNMTAPYPSHNEQFAAVLAQILHRPHLLRVPAFVVKALMGEAAVLVLGGQNALPKRLEEAGSAVSLLIWKKHCGIYWTVRRTINAEPAGNKRPGDSDYGCAERGFFARSSG